ncbi:MAG: chaperone NapD [Betaproteobacteria bacterium]|nr:chaperone NapD [Betaproteobacteria bacterium]
MNLSGILVVAKPEWRGHVVDALNALEGVEVHQVDEASGRIIAVQEAENIHAEIEGVKRIKALPHVIVAEMVYHYLAEDERTYESLPPELQEQQDGFETCAVPAYLNS